MMVKAHENCASFAYSFREFWLFLCGGREMWKRKKKYSPVKYDGDLSKEYNRVLKDILKIERLFVTQKMFELDWESKKVDKIIKWLFPIYVILLVINVIVSSIFLPSYYDMVQITLILVFSMLAVFLLISKKYYFKNMILIGKNVKKEYYHP
ncbi:hypothetical protein [Streptococcus sobrinus]|uniref:hypothetical protein n=2 Tax=Streptococcus sobrinus TaxID=1310 RepID=UPI0020D25401|nr:hypothetical protein [Streptococcus sobrinus]